MSEHDRVSKDMTTSVNSSGPWTLTWRTESCNSQARSYNWVVEDKEQNGISSPDPMIVRGSAFSLAQNVWDICAAMLTAPSQDSRALDGSLHRSRVVDMRPRAARLHRMGQNLTDEALRGRKVDPVAGRRF